MGTYFDFFAITQTCLPCPANCATCNGSATGYCLSCNLGYRLNVDTHQCDACSYADDPVDPFTKENAGICYEDCGKGSNWNHIQCDDGNLSDGDGCNKECEVEDDFMCWRAAGGDICWREWPEFLALNASNFENLLIEFTTDVIISDDINQG